MAPFKKRPYGAIWRHMSPFAPFPPYGAISCFCQMKNGGAPFLSPSTPFNGAIWRHLAPFIGAIWRHLAPYGANGAMSAIWRENGAIFAPYGAIWRENGAIWRMFLSDTIANF